MSSSRRSTSVTSGWVTSLTLHLLKGCGTTQYVNSTSLRFVQNGVQGHHLASTHLWRQLPKLTWQPVISLRKFRRHPDRRKIPRVLKSRDLYL